MVKESDIMEAERELKALIKGHNVHSGELVAQLLERELFSDVKMLGSLDADESDVVKKFMRAFIALGEPDKAARLGKKTNVSIDWKEDPVAVKSCYRWIATKYILKTGNEVIILPEGGKLIKTTLQFTGIAPPEDVVKIYQEAVVKSPLSKISTNFRGYRNAGLELTQEFVDRVYDVAMDTPSTDAGINRAKAMLKFTGTKPSRLKDDFLQSVYRLESLKVIGDLFSLCNAEQLNDFVYPHNRRDYVSAIARVESGLPLEKDYAESLYEYAINNAVSKHNGYYLPSFFGNNVSYLISHGIKPPQNVESMIPFYLETKEQMMAVLSEHMKL